MEEVDVEDHAEEDADADPVETDDHDGDGEMGGEVFGVGGDYGAGDADGRDADGGDDDAGGDAAVGGFVAPDQGDEAPEEQHGVPGHYEPPHYVADDCEGVAAPPGCADDWVC